jgi:hypothetical protein
MRGRKKKLESRAQEIRASLVVWKQTPKSSRPSLRALARELGTSHQLLAHYYDGLEDWQHRERCQEIRARAKAENREMTLRECLDAIITPGLLDQIESIRRDAKRGPLNHYQIQMLKLLAHRFPEAQELLQKCSGSALKRRSFSVVVKETRRQEGETQVSWVRRIWDQCAKFGTRCPDVITEELLQGITTNRKKNLPAIPIGNC